jgi:hypothetical protein
VGDCSFGEGDGGKVKGRREKRQGEFEGESAYEGAVRFGCRERWFWFGFTLLVLFLPWFLVGL